MGGLIVWGVDCRKDADGVDQVSGFMPIEGLAKFASDMRDWSVEVLMPRHAGISVEALDEGGDRGFLLIDVERSERRPHRSEAGDKSYFRRAGASSRAMEHFEIEDAFKRVSLPELAVERAIGPGGGMRTPAFANCFASLNISLRNTSLVSARSVYVITPTRPPRAPWTVDCLATRMTRDVLRLRSNLQTDFKGQRRMETSDAPE